MYNTNQILWLDGLNSELSNMLQDEATSPIVLCHTCGEACNLEESVWCQCGFRLDSNK